ncbi:MAG: bifunctional riboflavin kinase/FAD synthetase [Phycisphaerales bacterium]
MSGVALSVGNFDGVHLGHAALIERAREVVGADGRVVAMAFDPHPRSVLAKGGTPGRLTTFEHRRELLRALGADEVERLTPTEELLGRSPEAFVDGVLRRHEVGVFVEGEDFCFGKGRAGDVGTLEAIGRERGFGVSVVGPVEASLANQTVVTCSSSIARWLLARGRVEDAARVLGRAYEVRGEVVRGDRRGRAIGFPTANVRTEQVLPADGVYAGVATIDGMASGVSAAVHVGPRGTFDAPERTMEVHLIGWTPSGDTEAYGASIRVGLLSWVRGNVRFESVGHLVDQLGRDVERCGALVMQGADA